VQVEVDITNGCTVCRPAGSLDVEAAARFRQAMAVVGPAPRLVVDLSQVSFIDSAALAALVSGIRRVREAGGDAAVCSTRPHVTRVLRMVGLERVVPIAGTMGEAESILAGSGLARTTD